MKNIALIGTLLILISIDTQAKDKSNIQFQFGFGYNFVKNNIKHNDLFYDFIYEDQKTSLNNHMSLSLEKCISSKKSVFISAGVEIDFAKYSFKTTAVPDTSFANTSFSFEHKFTTIDFPLSIEKATKFLNKKLIFGGGIGVGFYFNRRQSAISNIDIINYNKEELSWSSSINIDAYVKVNTTAFARIKAKILNYNCNPTKGGVWLEILAKQSLLHNSNVNSYAVFIFPNRPQPNEIYFTNNFKNRPLLFSFSVLVDLK